MQTEPLLIASMLVGVIAHITSGQAAAPPINDNFADAIRLTGTNVETSGSNVGATKEASEPDHAGNPGGSSVWWSWTADQTGYVTVSTWGSWRTDREPTDREPMDTLLGVYIGSSVSGLTLVANNDDRTDPVFGDWFGLATKSSQVAFIAKPGTIYYLAVDGYSEVDGSADEGTIQVALTVSSERPPGPPQMGPAPDWALPDVKGAVVNWSDFSGRVVLVNFWATWCHSCLEEIPDLVALQQKYTLDGFVVIGISVDDSRDEVTLFARDQSLNYPIVMSRPSKVVEQAYGGITGIPVSFIVDRQNNIVRKLVDTQKEATFELYVKPLIYANLAVRASCTNGRVVLRWPLTKAEFGLEATDDLLGGVWTAQTEAVQSDASGHFVELTTEAPWRYFRLRSQ